MIPEHDSPPNNKRPSTKQGQAAGCASFFPEPAAGFTSGCHLLPEAPLPLEYFELSFKPSLPPLSWWPKAKQNQLEDAARRAGATATTTAKTAASTAATAAASPNDTSAAAAADTAAKAAQSAAEKAALAAAAAAAATAGRGTAAATTSSGTAAAAPAAAAGGYPASEMTWAHFDELITPNGHYQNFCVGDMVMLNREGDGFTKGTVTRVAERSTYEYYQTLTIQVLRY
jgi:hypothetical protein